jgi:hypothetical protein
MTEYHAQFDGLGREALERIAIAAMRMADQRERDVKQLTEQITIVQTRCTELLMKVRELEGGIVLPGWWCPCGCFNGAAKEWMPRCRACDAARPQ